MLFVFHIVQMNGPVADTASTSNAVEGSAGAAKPWEHVWSVEEMRSTASNWHLANDVGVCSCACCYHMFRFQEVV